MNLNKVPASDLRPPIQQNKHPDYIAWLQQQDWSEAEVFWRQQLKGFTAPTPLVVDRTSSGNVPGQEEIQGSQEVRLSEAVTSALVSLAQQHRLTLTTIVQGAWALLLSRYSGEGEVLFGALSVGRWSTGAGAETVAGQFVNLLPIRVGLLPDMPVLPWLKKLQAQQLARQQYEHTPLAKLREWSDVPEGIPLFESIVAFENNSVDPAVQGQDGNGNNRSDTLLEQVNYPLTVSGYANSSLLLSIVYDRTRFDEATVVRLLGHLKTLLAGIANNPEQPLLAMPLLTQAEQQQLLVAWNDTQTDYPKDVCVHDLFEAQVERTPDKVAIVFREEQLTYRDLNRRANQLAHHLQRLGVGPETLVGICLERSLEMMVGLLGVLKAGGAYVPIDPAYPQERVAQTVEDAQVLVLLTQQELVAGLPQHQAAVVRLDADWAVIGQENEANPVSGVTQTNSAYVIYTSGSTGRPKGVQIGHRPLVNFLNSMRQAPGLSAADRLVAVTTISFDIAALELYLPLVVGGQVIIAERQVAADGAQLGLLLAKSRASVMQATPATWRMLVAQGWTGSDQLKILCGGEALSGELARQLLARGTSLWNLYGPTETTIWSSIYKVGLARAEDQAKAAVELIGRPIANTAMYILDQHLQPVPVGVAGELYIGGTGLAQGYLNRPKLTSEKFMPDPFSQDSEARLYQTGDLVRYRPDGNLEFLGRLDHQVKIRGFRLELGEVETTLRRHAAVRESVALVREDVPGDKRLVAYVVPARAQPPLTGELRSFLQQRLPDYMIPAAFVMLDALPLTPNGKVDRRALPVPNPARPELGKPLVAPRTPVEGVLAKMWGELLGLERVGIHDNFFELGGHSLLATQFIARLRKAYQVELPLHCIFDLPTIADLAKIIENGRQGEPDLQASLIRPMPREGELPLSFSQERVWYIQQLDPANKAYHFQATLRFEGRLDVAALEQSLNEIVRRHEIYRTTFPALNGRPTQLIHQPQAVNLPLVDLQVWPEGEREVEVERLISQEFQKSFNLAQLPLVRWTLLRLSAQEHILLHVEHHFVHDGWAFNVFLRELLELYKAFAVGNPSPFSEPSIQFADFAQWQRQWMQGEIADSQLAYWQEKLAGSTPTLQLPFDRPRPAVQTFEGAAPRIELPLNLCESLRAVSRQEGVTLFMTMLAAFVTLLYRYSGQDDICVGSGIANRRWRETEGLIGMIVNNIVLRTYLADNPTFRQLLNQVRQVTLEAYANQDVPFDKVVAALQPERDMSHNPLFQAMFSFHDAFLPDLELPGLTMSLQEVVSNGTAKFDLNIIVIPRSEQRVGLSPKAGAEGITMIWEYNTDLFDDTTISRMIEHYQMLLNGIAADPERRLSELPLLTAAERQQLLVEWNETQTDYPRHSTIQQLFEAQVEQTPNAVAIVFDNQPLTYRQLNRRANRLAHYLQALGVGPDVCVGLYLERSPEMIVGLLGILKAGGAYVPLDPEYPKERLAFMVSDTQAPVLLTQQALLSELPEYPGRVICLDTDWAAVDQEPDLNPAGETTAESLAYVMYTSGSTGRPKGTCISHRNVVRLVKNTNYADLSAKELFLQFAPISFDAATLEIWGPLLNGGQLVVFPAHKPSLTELGEVIQRYQVTTLWLTAGLFHQMVEGHLESLKSVRQLMAGGDVLSVPHVLKVLQELDDCTLINGYGPTENTTFTTCHPMTDPEQVGTSVSIGRPIAQTQVYVLDRQMQPVPVGVPGELYIGGDGLAQGYLNRPELTAQKFIQSPFGAEPGARLYKTGDLVRYLPGGNIEFLGRLDHQVKIRGFRIELREIETVLGQHPAVQKNVILAREDSAGNKRLVAYVVANRKPAPTIDELRQFLKQKLPEYMIPSAVVILDKLPLSPNGKVDRRALPAPDKTRPDLAESAFVGPGTEVEVIVAGICAQVLELDRIGIHDNFFELGGHSLLAMQVISRLGEAFQIELSLRSLFEAPTVADLAKHVETICQTVQNLRDSSPSSTGDREEIEF